MPPLCLLVSLIERSEFIVCLVFVQQWIFQRRKQNNCRVKKIDKNRKRHNYFCLLISLIYSIREEVVNVEEAIGVSSIIFMYWSTT